MKHCTKPTGSRDGDDSYVALKYEMSNEKNRISTKTFFQGERASTVKEVSKECLGKWILNSSFEQLTLYTCTGVMNKKSDQSGKKRKRLHIFLFIFQWTLTSILLLTRVHLLPQFQEMPITSA